MGKKDQRVKKTRAASKKTTDSYDSDDDGSIVASEESLDTKTPPRHFNKGGASELDELTSDEALDEAIDSLSDECLATRVTGLTELLKKCLACLTVEAIQSRYRLLMANLLPIARRPGSEDEGELVARVLAILSVILGPERDDYFDDVSSTLMRLIKHDRRESVRVEALNAYALIAFICCSDNDEAALSTRLNAVETFLNTTYPNSVVTAAMNAWGLLATTHVTETLAHSVLPLWLEVFVDFLEHANVDVRMAAGENIALLFEAAENTSTEVPEREAIAFVLLTLSKESSKRNAKKERKEQRVVFRDVCATVVERESPLLSLTINEEPMSFDGWHALKQLSAIRTCLKTGFQEHIQYNALLRALLELPDLDGVEQRQMIDSGSFRVKVSKSSSLSKDRSADRRNSRKQRESEKHAFLFDD